MQNNHIHSNTIMIKLHQSKNRSSMSSDGIFPCKLHDMLEYAEQNRLDDVVSWACNGRAFIVHDPDRLVEILPLFFNQKKYRSFRRQLNMWSFESTQVENNKSAAFQHPYFQRGRKLFVEDLSRESFKRENLLQNQAATEKTTTTNEDNNIGTTNYSSPPSTTAISPFSSFDPTAILPHPQGHERSSNNNAHNLQSFPSSWQTMNHPPRTSNTTTDVVSVAPSYHQNSLISSGCNFSNSAYGQYLSDLAVASSKKQPAPPPPPMPLPPPYEATTKKNPVAKDQLSVMTKQGIDESHGVSDKNVKINSSITTSTKNSGYQQPPVLPGDQDGDIVDFAGRQFHFTDRGTENVEEDPSP